VGQLEQRKNVHFVKTHCIVEKNVKRRIGRVTRKLVGILASLIDYFIIFILVIAHSANNSKFSDRVIRTILIEELKINIPPYILSDSTGALAVSLNPP
jgi:hypothetical protein